MIQDLLQQWSELEPERCDRQSKSYWMTISDYGYSIPFESPSFINLAILRSAVESAIVLRNLRCKLENDSNGWIAAVADGERYSSGRDKESATALLKAYIAYLEAKR